MQVLTAMILAAFVAYGGAWYMGMLEGNIESEATLDVWMEENNRLKSGEWKKARMQDVANVREIGHVTTI